MEEMQGWWRETAQAVAQDPTGFMVAVGGYLLIALVFFVLLKVALNRWLAATRQAIEQRELWDEDRKAGERERALVLARYAGNSITVLAAMLFVGLVSFTYQVPVLGHGAVRMRDWLAVGGLATLLRIGLVLLLARFLLVLVSKTAAALVPVSGKTHERHVARALTIRSVIESTAQIAVVTMIVLYVLAELGAQVGTLLAGVGILGLAISFGAQSLVKDVISGFFILVEDQYGVGDVVQIAGLAGLVESVNLRITTLRDLEGRVHVIPNGQIDKASVLTKTWSRALIDVDVAYRTDLDHALAVLNDEAQLMAQDPEWSWRVMEPPEVLGVDAFGDSGVRLRLLFKTLPREQWGLAREFRRRIKARFDREEIEIPFPHVTFYWGDKQMPRPSPFEAQHQD